MQTINNFVVPQTENAFFNINLKLVGSNCNMRCQYCYEHDFPKWAKKVIEPSEVKQLIQKIPAEYSIRFLLHGGEPLLYPKNKMEEILLIIKNVKRQVEFRIQTNGILIDNDWVDLFQRYNNNFVFSISLDSLEKDSFRSSGIQNFNQTIIEKLKFLKERDVKVGIVSVASKENINSYESFITNLIGLGVRYLTINKIRRNSNERAKSNNHVISEIEFVMMLEKILNFWINHRLYKKIEIQPFMTLLSPHSNKICTFVNSTDICKSFLSLYPNGLVTGCDHLDPKRIHRFEACNTCQIQNWCGSGCYGEEKDSSFCEARFKLKEIIDKVLHGSK